MADFHRLYPDILNYFLKHRFVRFLAVGCVTTLIDLTLFYFIHVKWGNNLILTNIISYGTGITTGFFINRAWTFKDSLSRSHRRIVLSLIYGYIGLGINTFLVWAGNMFMPVMAAKIAAVFIIVVYNYLTNKYLVFKIR